MIMDLKLALYCGSVVLVVLCMTGHVFGQDEACTTLIDDFRAQKQEKFLNNLASLIPRYVDTSGNDTEACLNYLNVTQPPPCKTPYYALNGNIDSNLTHSNDDVAIYLGPGSYILNPSTGVINSRRVAIIGSGVDETFLNCGRYLEEDRVCEFLNFQIRNSFFVYLTGITFTRCGPITSNMYVAFSDYIYMESCSFRYVCCALLLMLFFRQHFPY